MSEMRATVSIDDGPQMHGTISVDREVVYVESDIATKPDPRWEYVDRGGHFHAFDDGGELPTLIVRSRHVDCDGSCGGVCDGEGYDVEDYFCRICDEEIEPNRLPDPGPRAIPGQISWQVDVAAYLSMDTEVSIQIHQDGQMWFGTAVVLDTSFAISSAGMTEAATKLVGTSPLGVRKVAR